MKYVKIKRKGVKCQTPKSTKVQSIINPNFKVKNYAGFITFSK